MNQIKELISMYLYVECQYNTPIRLNGPWFQVVVGKIGVSFYWAMEKVKAHIMIESLWWSKEDLIIFAYHNVLLIHLCFDTQYPNQPHRIMSTWSISHYFCFQRQRWNYHCLVLFPSTTLHVHSLGKSLILNSPQKDFPTKLSYVSSIPISRIWRISFHPPCHHWHTFERACPLPFSALRLGAFDCWSL